MLVWGAGHFGHSDGGYADAADESNAPDRLSRSSRLPAIALDAHIMQSMA
jgi:hypothetical protein